jgi:hypothetical protein
MNAEPCPTNVALGVRCRPKAQNRSCARRPLSVVLAKRHGKESEYSDENPVHFEFVGVLDLLRIGVECEEDEVWYDIVSLKQPMERAKKILPPERKLNTIRAQASLARRSTRSRVNRTPG